MQVWQTGDNRPASLRARAIGKLKEFAAIAVYLYVYLGVLMLLKSAVLHDVGISYWDWGFAAVKAMVLAKFMLIGHALHLGRGYEKRPLIWPTLYRSLVFLALLLVLTATEEILVGLVHRRPLTASLAHVVGLNAFQGFATCLIMFLILVPYCAFKCLGEVLGEQTLLQLFFVERSLPIGVSGQSR